MLPVSKTGYRCLTSSTHTQSFSHCHQLFSPELCGEILINTDNILTGWSRIYFSIVDQILVFGICTTSNHENDGILIRRTALGRKCTSSFTSLQQFGIKVTKVISIGRGFQLHQIVYNPRHWQVLRDKWNALRLSHPLKFELLKNLAYMFLDDQIFYSLHNKVRTLRHQFSEHVDGFSPTS